MKRVDLAVLIAVALIAAACSNPDRMLAGAQPGNSPDIALPPLSMLQAPARPHRRVSTAVYELLGNPPLEMSPDGSAVYSAGQIALDPPKSSGAAWAVFSLDGFPTDGTNYPTLVSLTMQSDVDCWIGVADYSQQHWVFAHIFYSGPLPVSGGAALVSPAGSAYVAVISTSQALTGTSLQLTTLADLPGAPTPVLSELSKVVKGLPADFNAAGSSGGNGAITKCIYDFGDGSAPLETTDPAEEVHHTYLYTDPVELKLTVINDQGRSALQSTPLAPVEPEREVLVVYNADVPEDLDLANYYASARTGRAVDPAYLLGIHPAAAAAPQEITRDNYGATIRDPIKQYIDADSGIRSNVKYILLCKGVPHKIQGADMWDISKSTCSSVDSELCLMRTDGTYDYKSYIWNGDNYELFDASGFYLLSTGEFIPDFFKASTSTGQDLLVSYLVGRLTGYTYDDAKATVDRSLAADTSGAGWIVFDSCADRRTLDTMVDPVWPWSDTTIKSGYERLYDAGFNVFADITTTRIISTSGELPANFANSLIGYAGWGVNHTGGSYAHGSSYILLDLGWNYLPGACFMSYESFNGETFVCSNPDDLTIGHSGQGQIADFLHMGGTVAIGNCWEPWTIGVGDERWVFDRYINHGDRWIEAAYKGLRLLSWQEVVVGDPLCKVK